MQSMESEPCVIKEFLVTFSQKGLFLSDDVIKTLNLDRSNAVEIELYCRGNLTSKCYTVVKNINDFNETLEKKVYKDQWYYSNPFKEIIKDIQSAILGYTEWNYLALKQEKKDIILGSPFLKVKRIYDVQTCQEVRLRITRSEIHRKAIEYEFEFPDILSQKEEFPMHGYVRGRVLSIDGRKTGLKSLPQLGSKRRALLIENKINNILELISTPNQKTTKIASISNSLRMTWNFTASKVLELVTDPVLARVFSSKPPATKILITKDTLIEIISPFYAQFLVKGISHVESKILRWLNEYFGLYFNITMLRENVVTLTKKDGSREIVISGPWIIEMLGFEDKNEIDKVLNDIRITIMSSYDLWEEKGVVQLIDAQKEFIDADQVLKSLVSKFALQYSSTEAILRVMEADKKVVIDTSILIDERLSFLIVRATQGTLGIEYSIERPIIVIPNVVIYEIKSMLDRKSPKESQYRSGNQELLRLRALHDAGYVSVEYIGETPLLPPVAQYEKGSWRFISSLRDEYILNVLGKTSNSVLLTSDGRLATSAYARGQEVVLIKPLDMEINERLKEDLIDYKNLNEYEREKILIKICEDIMVSKDKISNLITQKVS